MIPPCAFIEYGERERDLKRDKGVFLDEGGRVVEQGYAPAFN